MNRQSLIRLLVEEVVVDEAEGLLRIRLRGLKELSEAAMEDSA